MTAAAAELLGGIAIEPAPLVDLLDDEPLEIELATTLLYQYSHHSYRQIREVVEALPEAQRREIIDLGLRHRGRHDEVSRAYCAGQQFRFDILMDIGGFRDMHRHRRCVQIVQDYTTAHGYDAPQEIEAAGLTVALRLGDEAGARGGCAVGCARCGRSGRAVAVRDPAGLSQAHAVQDGLCRRRSTSANCAPARRDTSPIATSRTRCTKRWRKRYPALAKYFRVTDVREPVDLLKRYEGSDPSEGAVNHRTGSVCEDACHRRAVTYHRR